MGIDRDSPSVQTYVTMLQGVIARMGGNSASCKTWCVTLIAAIAALGVNAEEHGLVLVGVLPLLIFSLLDAYYMGLERDFRDKYNTFVDLIHQQQRSENELFQLKPPKGWWRRLGITAAAVGSASIMPFYGILGVALGVTYFISAAQTP